MTLKEFLLMLDDDSKPFIEVRDHIHRGFCGDWEGDIDHIFPDDTLDEEIKRIAFYPGVSIMIFTDKRKD